MNLLSQQNGPMPMPLLSIGTATNGISEIDVFPSGLFVS